MNLAAIGVVLAAGWSAPQDAELAQLAKFGLKPNAAVSVAGPRVTLAGKETIEIVGITDFADPLEEIWRYNGTLLDGAETELFWTIMGFSLDKNRTELFNALKRDYATDAEKRTLAIAFKLSGGLSKANNVRPDVNTSYLLKLSELRPLDGEAVGSMQLLKPVLPEDYRGKTFDFRLEVPGGEWVTLAEFAFGPDTKVADGAIDVKMRWQEYSKFVQIEDRQVLAEGKSYYFTLTLPPVLRDMELEIVTNDPAEDAKLLPAALVQHFRGEDYDKKAFAGKDLFVTHGLNSRAEGRKFILRARPKRIVEFKGIPFKR